MMRSDKVYICKKCNSRKIKSKGNYYHGRKSKARITKQCRDCGSTDIVRDHA